MATVTTAQILDHAEVELQNGCRYLDLAIIQAGVSLRVDIWPEHVQRHAAALQARLRQRAEAAFKQQEG